MPRTPQQSNKVEAQAAVFVRQNIPHAQIDTAQYCSSFQEIVAVRLHIGRKTMLIASYYARPEPSCCRRGSQGGNVGYQWMLDTRKQYPEDRFLVAGDFNAHHPDWGYSTANARGNKLQETTEAARLMPINDLGYPTRSGLHAGQRDTTVDLTWTEHGIVKEWRCGADPMSSDHYPIWLQLNARSLRQSKPTTQTVDWDAFRAAMAEYESNLSITQKLKRAVQDSTRVIQVS